jgi:hypothetical protein
MNSKVKIQKNKTKLDMCLRQSLVSRLNFNVSSGRPLPAPIYRWLGLEDQVGFYTNSPYMAVYISISVFKYNIIQLLSWGYISMGLTRIHLRGTNIISLGSHTVVR